MTRGLGGSLLPYRVRDFHSLFLASFPGAQPDPDAGSPNSCTAPKSNFGEFLRKFDFFCQILALGTLYK